MIYSCNPSRMTRIEAGSMAERIMARIRITGTAIVVAVLPHGVLATEIGTAVNVDESDLVGTYDEKSELDWIVEDLLTCTIQRAGEQAAQLMTLKVGGPRLNLVGEKFGRLRVESEAPCPGDGHHRWNCVCECGRRIVARQDKLRSQALRSCGCAQYAVRTLRSLLPPQYRLAG